MENKNKMILAVAGIGLIGAGALMGGILPNETEVPYEVEKIVTQVVNLSSEQESIAFQNGVNSVEVPKQVEVFTEVEVQSEDFKIVYDYMYDMEGDMSDVMDDLEDDEIELLAERVFLINEAKDLSVEEIEAELFDELDRDSIVLSDNSTLYFDEDDMKKLRIDNDLDELEILESDFDNNEFTVKVTGTFKQDDVYFNFEAEVEIEDNMVDDFEIVSISERV